MGVYRPESLGINASTTGGVFKQGGWYNGRQYWNGTLSEPGQIHPESNQQGAGQQVSQEVVQQTNPNNWAYIQEEQRKAAAKPVAPVANPQPAAGPAKSSTGMPSTGGATGGMGVTAPTINLPQLYQNMYKESGISDLESELSAKEKAYNDRISKVNDDPFLSEATRVGRLKKLSTDYENSVASLKNDVAVKKADIETKLNLETKQFDINSTQAQLALSQFNTLLGAGALDNASGEDIANIVRSTGLSSTMIQSAVQARKDKAVETSTISFDDGTNQGFAIINSKTGEIISKQTVAASKPSTAKASETEQKSYYMNSLRQDAANGMKLGQIFELYTGYLEPDLIYQLYNSNSKYGPDKGNVSALAKYGVKQPTY